MAKSLVFMLLKKGRISVELCSDIVLPSLKPCRCNVTLMAQLFSSPLRKFGLSGSDTKREMLPLKSYLWG